MKQWLAYAQERRKMSGWKVRGCGPIRTYKAEDRERTTARTNICITHFIPGQKFFASSPREMKNRMWRRRFEPGSGSREACDGEGEKMGFFSAKMEGGKNSFPLLPCSRSPCSSFLGINNNRWGCNWPPQPPLSLLFSAPPPILSPGNDVLLLLRSVSPFSSSPVVVAGRGRRRMLDGGEKKEEEGTCLLGEGRAGGGAGTVAKKGNKYRGQRRKDGGRG